MGLKKRVSALLLAVLISFGVCAVDYLKVDALEVGGSVVWDTAINYLLGLLGLSPIAENGDKIVDFDSMRSKWVQDYEAYFYANVQPEDLPEGYTKERAYQNWIDNVCRGNLNTVDYGAWDIFKAWAETLPGENSGGGSGGSWSSGEELFSSTVFNYLKSNFGFNQSVNFDLNSVWNSPCIIVIGNNGSYTCYIVTFGNRSIDSISVSRGSWGAVNFNITFGDRSSSTRYYLTCNNSASQWTSNSQTTSVASTLNIAGYTGNIDCYLYGYNGVGALDSGSAVDRNITYKNLSISGSSTSDISYDSVTDRISDVQIINDYSTTTTQNVVSIDWDKIGAMINDAVGTITGSLDRTITDALDDAQEKVAAGSMSVANYNDYVTEISNTYVYDITNETSITNPDSTVTGVVSGNVSKAEFTLAGLQYVFPFCIPWDIRDFVTLLVADPVAPVIEYPIYNPVTDTDEIVTIDFSLWENQVRVVRYIFDFLLIIGLLLLARSLIGAGGGD